MSARDVYLLLCFSAIASVLVWYGLDPRRKPMPEGELELSMLVELSEQERVALSDFKRTNPYSLPDGVRSIADALAWQRNFERKMAEHRVHEREAREKSDQRFEPLRQSVRGRIERAMVLPINKARSLIEPVYGDRLARGEVGHPVLVVYLSIENTSGREISAVSGSFVAHREHDFLPLQLCYLSERPLAVGQRESMPCVHHDPADQSAYAFAEDSGQFEIYWQPREVKFSDGSFQRTAD
jgi:hypothetical protein